MRICNAQPRFFILITALLAIHPRFAGSATLLVDSLDDGIINDTNCTLREAVTAANTDSDGNGCEGDGSYGNDLIIFSQPGQINLTDELEISDDLEIGGDGGVSLDAGGNSRVLRVDGDGVALRLTALTIQNGNAPDGTIGGGCIFVFGAATLLELTDVLVQNCTTVRESVFGSSGGAIAIGRSPLVEPRAADDVSGGLSTTQLTLTRSTVRSSSVAVEDGFARGGAIVAGPDRVAVTIVDSRIVDNVADSSSIGEAHGGGLYITAPAPLEMTRSQISGNRASTTGSNAFGGGLFIGEIEAPSRILNSTIAGNVAASDGVTASEVRGGAIFATVDDDVTLELGNNTIVQNVLNASGGATAFPSGGVGFTAGSGPVFLSNTILANNSANDQPADCEATGVLVSRGHNLIKSNCGISAAAGDLFSIDPELGPFTSNGGALSDMESFLPLPSSPALDAGSPETVQSTPSSCRALDQRSLPRPVDAGGGLVCDIGAIEMQAAPLSPARPVPGLNAIGIGLLACLMLWLAFRHRI